MSQPVHTAGLIDNKRLAVAVCCLTAFLMLISFRHGIAHPTNGSYWLFDMRTFFPARLAITLNLLFYAYLLVAGVSVYRAARGQERLVVIGWFAVIVLGPVQHLLSISANVIGYLNLFALITALLASLSILFKVSASATAQQSPD